MTQRALVGTLLLAALTAAPPAQAGLPHYAEESGLIATTPGTDDGSVAALWNPAQWGLLERSEAAFWWSDNQVLDHRRDDYGFSVGSGLGLSYRHRIFQAPGGPRGVGEYQIGLGCGDGGQAGGIAYGFSGPGRSVFGRENFLALGSILRPTPWLSLGSTGRIASGEQQGVLDLGVRPLSDPRVLLFASYALENDRHWDDGDPSGGIALRPIVGLLVGGRWSENERFQLTLGLTLARTGFRSLTQFAKLDRGATNYVGRLSPPVRGLDPAGRLLRGRRFLEMSLHGDAVYQSYRFFDERSLPLRRILEDIQFAIEDPTVGGVAINLSGFNGNVEMVWEVREKLLDLKRAGKKSVVYIDRAGAAEYYLASAADRIVMDPLGTLLIPGVQASRTYMKDALEKAGIGFEEWRYFKYKSALEALSRRNMSDADREQRRALVKAAYLEMAEGVAGSGRTTRARLDSTVNQEPYMSPRRLLELHWIDEVGGAEALREAAKTAAGTRVLLSKAREIRRRRWQPDEAWGPVPTIVLAYAVGDCAMDTGIRGRETSRALKKFRERRDVKAVVVRVDSPGGDPLASDLVARELKAYRRAKKPLYVSQGRVAASGGYWISMDAARVTASPFTITGSIGVIGGWAWNEGLGKKLGLTSDHVQIGRSADLFGGLTLPLLGVKIPERNLDEHERVVVKRAILELYDDFTKRVAEGRGLEIGRVREIAEGHVYAGREAVDLGLVDEIAPLDRTIEEAKAAAGIPKGRRVRIEEYPRQRLFPLPGLARWVAARIAGSAGGGGSGLAGDGGGALGGDVLGSLESSSERTYEERTLGRILLNPGLPLLLTPPSLLPDEPAAR